MPVVEIFSGSGMEEMDVQIKDMFGNLFPKKRKQRKVKIPEALEILTQEEAQRLIDMDRVTKDALDRVQPILHNFQTRGLAWREHGITADQVLRRNRHVRDGSPELWVFVKGLVEQAVAEGFLDEKTPAGAGQP